MSRAVLHDTANQYVQGLGIDIKFSARFINYFETDNHADVILEDESRLTADVVVAADGIDSKSWNLLSGYQEKAVSSSFAVPVNYPVEHALNKHHTAKKYGNVQDKCKLFAGDGAHIIVARAGANR